MYHSAKQKKTFFSSFGQLYFNFLVNKKILHFKNTTVCTGLPRWLSGSQSACQAGDP